MEYFCCRLFLFAGSVFDECRYSDVIMHRNKKVAKYYVIPSEILSVRPSALHDFVSAP